MVLKSDGPRMLVPSVFWLGSTQRSKSLQVNSYAVARGNRAVLIDPGPAPIYKEMSEAFFSLTEKVLPDAIILSHQDPDVCASLPLWVKAGFRGPVISHWKTALLIPSLCSGLKYISLTRKRNQLPPELLSLDLIGTPYLHAPGSLAVFDSETGVLFPGDIFGSVGKSDKLFSDMEQIEKMVSFHEIYMPSIDFLRNFLNEIKKLDISLICPQHGSIIREHKEKAIEILENIQCGKLNPDREIQRLVYDRETQSIDMDKFELQKNIVLNNDDKLLDPVSGMYNQLYFNSYSPLFIKKNKQGTIAYFRLDKMKEFNDAYGYKEGDSAISVLAQILISKKPPHCMTFRGPGPVLIALYPDNEMTEVSASVKEILQAVSESREFLKPMTCSAALIPVPELDGPEEDKSANLKKALLGRLRTLDRMGENSICSSIWEEKKHRGKKVIMLLEPDRTNGIFLRDYLTGKGFEVAHYSHGRDILHNVDLERPALIISEVHISPVDVFQLRMKLLALPDLRHIPFLLISHLKSDIFIRRAFQLNIQHYLKKPLSLVELEGLVNYLLETEPYDS